MWKLINEFGSRHCLKRLVELFGFNFGEDGAKFFKEVMFIFRYAGEIDECHGDFVAHQGFNEGSKLASKYILLIVTHFGPP